MQVTLRFTLNEEKVRQTIQEEIDRNDIFSEFAKQDLAQLNAMSEQDKIDELLKGMHDYFDYEIEEGLVTVELVNG